MIRSVCRALIVGVVVAAAPLGSAHAQIVDEEGIGRLSIGGLIGMGLTSMSDVNQNIDVANRFLRTEEVRDMDHVNTGILTGLDIRYKFSQTPLVPDDEGNVDGEISFLQRFGLGFTLGAVNSESSFDVSRATTRFYSRATTYYPYLMWFAPWIEESLPRMTLYFAGGPLFLTGGSVEWALGDSTTNNFIEEGDLSEIAGSSRGTNDGVGFIVQAGSGFQLNSMFSVTLDVGYRAANTSATLTDAVGQDKRFTGDDDPDNITVVRRPGDWSVIDFWRRSPTGEFEGRNRPDDMEDGGCADCPLYYTGDAIDIDFSGFFASLSFRVHF